jgi:hypothetical protein
MESAVEVRSEPESGATTMAGEKRRRVRDGTRWSAGEVDQALNRLFTQELRREDAELLIAALRPLAADLAPSLVTLLNSPDRKTRTTASALLASFEEPTSVPLLRQLLDHPGASDETKLAAYTVLQTLGVSPGAGQFLQKLRDPDALFAHGIEQLREMIGQDAELAQVIELFETMPESGHAALLAELGACGDGSTWKFFAASLWSAHPQVAATAVTQLRRLREPRAVEPLLDLAAITRRPDLAELARGAALELRMRASVAEKLSATDA